MVGEVCGMWVPRVAAGLADDQRRGAWVDSTLTRKLYSIAVTETRCTKALIRGLSSVIDLSSAPRVNLQRAVSSLECSMGAWKFNRQEKGRGNGQASTLKLGGRLVTLDGPEIFQRSRREPAVALIDQRIGRRARIRAALLRSLAGRDSVFRQVLSEVAR